jgi:hypothetical protein
MIHRLFNRSILGTIISALFLLTSSTAFAQTRTGNPDNPDKPVVNEEFTAAKITKEKNASSAGRNFSALKTSIAKTSDLAKEPTVAKPQSGASGSNWKFAFAPYLYMTGIAGTVGAGGRTANIDLNFGDVMKHFKFGLMGTFEARKGKLVILNDMIWIKLSEERNTPGGLYSTAKIGVNMFVWNPEAGYRLYESDRGSFDLFGGIRLTSVESTLKFTSGTLPGFDVNVRKTWAAPLVGAHGLLNVSPKVFLSTVFDAGGGFGTQFTGQFYAGAGYRFTPKIAMIGGYRYFKNNFHDSEGFVFNTRMNGILVGARFDF